MIDRSIINNNRDEIWTLDLIKYLLAILVIIRHCGQAYWSYDSLFVKIFTCSVSPVAVPLFFAISGFLLFRRTVSASVLKKQLFRIIKLYLLWSLVFSPIIVREAIRSKSIALWLLGFIKESLFGGAFYHLWFLPSLAVALFLTYILAKKIKYNRYLLLIGFILYVIGTIVDTYHFFPPYTDWKLYKEVFLTTRNGIFFGFLFVVIGKTVAQSQTFIRNMKTSLVGFFTIIGLMMLVVEGWFLCEVKYCSVVNMNFSSVILAPVILIIAIKASDRLFYANGKLLRNMSTVLFCCHPLVMYVVSILNKPFRLDPTASTIMSFAFSALFAYLFVKLAVKIKFLNHFM